MKRTPLKRKRELARKRGLKRGKERLRSEARLERRTAMKKSNRKRKAKRYERDFGDKADFVRAQPCAVCGQGPSDPHHEPPRGAGGRKADLTNLCRPHHAQRHRMGLRVFNEFHGLDLLSIAKELEGRWQELQEGQG